MKRVAVLDGNISVGKSTLGKNLKRELERRGYIVRLVLEWKDGAVLEHYYKNMAGNALETETVFLGHRMMDYKDGIEWLESVELGPNDAGAILLCDRWAGSSLVFASQSITEDAAYETFYALWRQLLTTVRQPDVILYLDASPETVHQRTKERAAGVTDLAASDRDDRSMEAGIPLSYLSALDAKYAEYCQNLADQWNYTALRKLDWNNFGDTEVAAALVLAEKK